MEPALLSPSSKNKTIYLKKISYTSRNENPEKISYIFSKEGFSYIFGNGNPETETLKSFLYFRR